MSCSPCATALDNYISQKFGYQRANFETATGDLQKSANGFDPTVYYPTNWRGTYDALLGKFPEFLRFGALRPVSPEYFQKNYLGIYPLKQQPLVEEQKPYTTSRYS